MAVSAPCKSRAACFARRIAALAQSVEHIIRNDGVTCSSHVSGTIFFKIKGLNTGLYRWDIPVRHSLYSPPYILKSRHGVFYFRWPLPNQLHPQKQATTIKLSYRRETHEKHCAGPVP